MKFGKVLNEVIDLDRINKGSILIEFMDSNGKISLVVKFDNNINWLFNNGDKPNKPIYFKSIQDFKKHIENSISSFYGSDIKSVYKNIFDPNSMNVVWRQIDEFVKQYPMKAKSLTFDNANSSYKEKNSDWDMKIQFKVSLEDFAKNGNYKIKPTISGSGLYGKIVGSDEIESTWSNRRMNKYTSSLK